MGKLIWKDEEFCWYIDDNDKVKVGETIEYREILGEGDWETIVVHQDSTGNFHDKSKMTLFDRRWEVRRPIAV